MAKTIATEATEVPATEVPAILTTEQELVIKITALIEEIPESHPLYYKIVGLLKESSEKISA